MASCFPDPELRRSLTVPPLMRSPHGSSQRSLRHRPAPKPAISQTPLGQIAQEHEAWRRGLPGKPSRGALREYWRSRDALHGPRADYQLWRTWMCADCPPERRQDSLVLLSQALRSKDQAQVLATLTLAAGWLLQEEAEASPALVEKVRLQLAEALPRMKKTHADPATAWIIWLGTVAAGDRSESMCAIAQQLFKQVDPTWRPGRCPSLPTDDGFPAASRVMTRWVVTALRHLPWDAAGHQSIWRLQGNLRPAGALIRPLEWELLMRAASTARSSGQLADAARLTALGLHLLPDRSPHALRDRATVAAWFLAEQGITPPAAFAVSLDELIFPGEPATSEKGREAVRLYRDEADCFQNDLLMTVATDEDWQILQAAGVSLQHPLAALAWVGRRAQSYLMKKQTDVLRAAAKLCLRHGALSSLARIRAEFPDSAHALLELARGLRESQRRMPLLRDWQEWQRVAMCLRAAWAKLGDAAEFSREEESLFLLHEMLLDQQTTLQHCLPENLRALQSEASGETRRPSALIRALNEEPKLMRCLEHQRAVELWSISAELRERTELADCAWISVVTYGSSEAQRTRVSWILQTAAGRRIGHGKLRSDEDKTMLVQALIASSRELCPAEPRRIILASDVDLLGWPDDLSITKVASWEAAFRDMRNRS